MPSEASNVSLPSRRQHWMSTRLRTKLRAGRSRPHYQQLDYSTSDTDDEPSEAMLPIPTYPQDPEHPVSPPGPPAEPMSPDPQSDVIGTWTWGMDWSATEQTYQPRTVPPTVVFRP